jgi:hypothetical protein
VLPKIAGKSYRFLHPDWYNGGMETVLEQLNYPGKVIMRERGVITAVGITHKAKVDERLDSLMSLLESLTPTVQLA